MPRPFSFTYYHSTTNKQTSRFKKQLTKQIVQDAEFSQELFSNAPIDNQTTVLMAQKLSHARVATNATTSNLTLFHGSASFEPADKQDTRKRPRSLICHSSVDRILQRDVLQKVKEVGMTPICILKPSWERFHNDLQK